VLAQITAAFGQTLMAIYTIPDGLYAWLTGWRGSTDGNAAGKVALQFRPENGAWRTSDMVLMDSAGNSSSSVQYQCYPSFEPKTDFRVRTISGGNNMDIVAQFDLIMSENPKEIVRLGGI